MRAKKARALRGQKAPTIGGYQGRTPESSETRRLEEAAQMAVAAGSPEFADSVCTGIVLLSFWRGGKIPADAFASHFTLSPSLRPEQVAPFLRTIADELEHPGSHSDGKRLG